MFLRAKTRKKDGKEHRTWSVVENRRVPGGCVIHAMSVHGFTASRSRISPDVGQGFHGMSVQHFRACRSSS